MKILLKALLLVVGGLFAFAASAQEDEPVGYTYGTYYVCDVATQGDMDDIVEQYEKPVFDKWLDEGKINGWGYYSHFTGGQWRRLQWHAADTLNEAVNNQVAIFQEIYSDNAEAGARRSDACEAHDDYVWSGKFYVGGDELPPGSVSLSVYFVCDQSRESEADRIAIDTVGPLYAQLVEDGKLTGWGWSSHVLGGEYRRLAFVLGESYSQVLDARAAVIQQMQGSAAGARFSQICPSHTDYLWNVVH